MRWFWLVCLSVSAVEDIRSRKISGKLLTVCGLAGLAAAWMSGLGTHLPGLLVGVSVLAVSRITRGAIGAGDGLFLLASAWYLTAGEIWILFSGGLTISWVWSVWVIVKGMWNGKSTRRRTLPFLACLWPVGAWIVVM